VSTFKLLLASGRGRIVEGPIQFYFKTVPCVFLIGADVTNFVGTRQICEPFIPMLYGSHIPTISPRRITKNNTQNYDNVRTYGYISAINANDMWA
jgi:hypothetical protein